MPMNERKGGSEQFLSLLKRLEGHRKRSGGTHHPDGNPQPDRTSPYSSPTPNAPVQVADVGDDEQTLDVDERRVRQDVV